MVCDGFTLTHAILSNNRIDFMRDNHKALASTCLSLVHLLCASMSDNRKKKKSIGYQGEGGVYLFVGVGEGVG